MFVVKGQKQESREVSLVQLTDGVAIVINGITVARFDDDDDRIIFVGGIIRGKTGLNDSNGGHIQSVWDTDKDTSKSYNAFSVSKRRINDSRRSIGSDVIMETY